MQAERARNSHEDFAPQLTPGTHSQLGGLVGVVGGRERRLIDSSASGGT